MRGRTSPAANKRFRERWMLAPSPRANVVNPMQFVAERSALPDAPCFFCEARGACRHRELEVA